MHSHCRSLRPWRLAAMAVVVLLVHTVAVAADGDGSAITNSTGAPPPTVTVMPEPAGTAALSTSASAAAFSETASDIATTVVTTVAPPVDIPPTEFIVYTSNPTDLVAALQAYYGPSVHIGIARPATDDDVTTIKGGDPSLGSTGNSITPSLLAIVRFDTAGGSTEPPYTSRPDGGSRGDALGPQYTYANNFASLLITRQMPTAPLQDLVLGGAAIVVVSPGHTTTPSPPTPSAKAFSNRGDDDFPYILIGAGALGVLLIGSLGFLGYKKSRAMMAAAGYGGTPITASNIAKIGRSSAPRGGDRSHPLLALEEMKEAKHEWEMPVDL